MQPTIQDIKKIKLKGVRIEMSFSNMPIQHLWKSFMPRRKEIQNTVDSDLFSVEVYKDLAYFQHFDPEKSFEKWAGDSGIKN